MFKYIDMHCHCNEIPIEELEDYIRRGIYLVGVSEDRDSIHRILELKNRFKEGFTPCIGIHPWVVHEYSVEDAVESVKLALENNVRCLGEVGLDKVFVPKTYDHQLEIFKVYVEAAREYGFILNLHTPGTWREVYEILVRNDIDKAYFHWYTGPINLLEEIEASGYFIGANPAYMIQEKHRRILDIASLDIIITESDAPYNYKGLRLSPSMVVKTIEFLAESRRLGLEEVAGIVLSNAKKLLGFS